MAPPKIAPSGVERPLGIEELFFSTTDPGGRIRTCNETFVRVSAHPREELIGAAHNILRHPAMPRAVFQLFWDRIHAGLPVAAYVQNLAADGGHYWVMALAEPVRDELLSIRMKPTTPLLEAARGIYADVLAVEQAVEGGDPRARKASIAAGGERLLELLAQAGFADYEAFMHAALTAEVRARDEAVGEPAHDRLAVACETPPGAGAVLAAAIDAHQELDRFVRELGAYAATSTQLSKTSSFLSELARDVRDFSLNATLAAARLDGEGATLSVVAQALRICSEATGRGVTGLEDDIAKTRRRLGEVGYRIASAKLQVEVAMVFTHELADGHGHAELAVLGQALDGGVQAMLASLRALASDLAALGEHATTVNRELRMMRALELNGRIEAAQVHNAETVVALFASIAQTVAEAMTEVRDFHDITTAVQRRDGEVELRLERGVAQTAQAIAALAA